MELDPTTAFFQELEARGYDPGLEKVTGKLRFDLTNGKRTARWLVAIEKGEIDVSHKNAKADCVVRGGQDAFRRHRSGRGQRFCRRAAGADRHRGQPGAAGPLSTSLPSTAEEPVLNDDLVKILDGNTFVVSDSRGDIEASLTDPTGLFSFDNRFLSTWILTVDGERLNPLSVDDLQYFETRFFLVPGTGTVYVDAKLSVIRRRAVGDGFHEELTILNHDADPVDLKVRVEAASDFADLFEVKDALEKKGRYYARRTTATWSSATSETRSSARR